MTHTNRVLIVVFVGLPALAAAVEVAEPDRNPCALPERAVTLGSATSEDSSAMGCASGKHPSGPELQAASPAADREAPCAGWRFEVFGSGSAAGLVARGGVTFEAAEGRFDEEIVSYSREAGWGTGLRGFRGPWGIELQQRRLAGKIFTPTAVTLEAVPTPWADPYLPGSSADLVAVLGLREFAFPQDHTRVFIGIGGGYAFLQDEFSDLADAFPPGIPTQVVSGDEGGVISMSADVPRRSDRGVGFVAASSGFTMRSGRFLIRPRLDAFLGWTRQTDERWNIVMELPDTPLIDTTLQMQTRVRPRVFLFSVDIGWSSRR